VTQTFLSVPVGNHRQECLCHGRRPASTVQSLFTLGACLQAMIGAARRDRLQADSYNGSQGDVARERATYDGEENLNAKGSVAQGFAE